MISLDNISIRIGKKLLIENASCTIHKGQRFGIIGNNGCGKSTLFSLILGKLEPDEGTLNIQPNMVFSHVKQEIPQNATTALNYTLEGDKPLIEIRNAISQAEENNQNEMLSELYEQLSAIDGYTADSRASKLLNGLGFSNEAILQPVDSFSGGWKMRLNLAQALMSRSDVMLLDEPTNHLDLNAVVWLQQWLESYQGILLLISHDRDFLDNSVNSIIHISHQQLSIYSGNYTNFLKQHQLQQEQQQANIIQQQKKRDSMEAFVERFGAKATKAKQAQSRQKALDRMEKIAPIKKETKFNFSFQKTNKLPHILLDAKEISFKYTDKLILDKVSVQLTSGQRIGLMGVNGAGKTTLIKVLAGVISPTTGSIEISKGINLGYFSQTQLDSLSSYSTPLEHLIALDNKSTETKLRAHLGSFGFKGDMVNHPIKQFSGGEQARLALALLVYKQPDILLLDEPTNHLDISMRDTLAQALSSFHGALIIISHDTHMIREITDELYIVADKKITFYKLGINNYINSLLNSEKGSSTNKPNKPKNTIALRKKAAKLENSIEKLNTKKNTIEQSLSEHSLYTDSDKSKLIKLQKEKQEIEETISQTESKWLDIQQEIES